MTNNNNKRVLYFEGAGWSEADTSKETIGNCRIRTAFTNNKGKQIYLEMMTAPVYKDKEIDRYAIYIDFVHYITDDKDDCNNGRIPYDRENLRNNYNYTIEDITKWINKHLNCNFESIQVLPDLSGYRVHKDGGGYNLVDNFNYNIEAVNKREEIKKHFYNLEKSEGKKYPNFSLWVDQENTETLHLLRHFNGYNKHWTIEIDKENYLETMQEVKLGKYGC